MMFVDYQTLHHVGTDKGPVNGLDTYCRLEGLDPLYVRSSAERGRKNRKSNREVRVQKGLFAGLMSRIRLFMRVTPRY